MGFFVLFCEFIHKTTTTATTTTKKRRKKKGNKKKQTQGHFKLSGCLDASVGTLTIPVLSAFQMQTFVV